MAEVKIDGKVINNVPPRDRDVAMVFQNYALYPHMSVARENIGFALEQRRLAARSRSTSASSEAARILDLSLLLDRKPKQLSGGQRQRVAMGRALVRHPQAFLLDEPLSNLDAKLRVQMRAELGRLPFPRRRHNHPRDARPDRGDDARQSSPSRVFARNIAAIRYAARHLPRSGQRLRRRICVGSPAAELSRRRA